MVNKRAVKKTKKAVEPILDHAYKNLREELNTLTEALKSQAQQGKNELTKSIEQHPLRALGIAALVGFVLGCHIKRH